MENGKNDLAEAINGTRSFFSRDREYEDALKGKAKDLANNAKDIFVLEDSHGRSIMKGAIGLLAITGAYFLAKGYISRKRDGRKES